MGDPVTRDDVEEIVQRTVNGAIDNFSIHLFRYLGERFEKIDKRFEATDKKIDGYANAVVDFAATNERYMQEMLALGHKVDRHEQWTGQISEGTDIKLVPEI